jgi:tetratricopeptide (TPR) repeat protein
VPFGWILHALGLAKDAVQARERLQERAKEKFDQQFADACIATGKDRERLLAHFCQECARRIEKDPKDSNAVYKWGCALLWRASIAAGGEADRFYEQADKKFAQAQKLQPNNAEFCATRVEAIRRRAVLDSGEGGRRLLLQVCELAQARVGICASGVWDAWTMATWGLALRDLATREKPEEAIRLYESAEEKLREAYAITPEQTNFQASLAEVMLWRASQLVGEPQRQVLTEICDVCREVAAKGAGGAASLDVWASALLWLAAASQTEAKSYCREAEEKFDRALRVDPNDRTATIGRVKAQLEAARVTSGSSRLEQFARVCEECQKLDANGFHTAEVATLWGTALLWRAWPASGADLERLLWEAEERYRSAIASWPSDTNLKVGFALALTYRARHFYRDQACSHIAQASDLFQAVLRDRADPETLTQWASILLYRVKCMPGEETDRMITNALEKLEAAAGEGGDRNRLLLGWASLLWAQASSVSGEDATRLRQKAKEMLLESEAATPHSADYHLAVLCSSMGATEECRSWLERSGEPGIIVSRDDMERLEEFAPVRNCDWFRAALAKVQ